MRRLAGIAISVLALLQAPVSAGTGDKDDPPPEDPPSDVGYDEGTQGVFAGYDAVENPIGEVGGPVRGRTAPRVVCWLVHAPDGTPDPGGVVGSIVSTPTEGNLYLLMCRRGDAAATPVRVIVYRVGDPTDGTVVTETQVTEYMLALFEFELPAIETSPPPEVQVVNIETWLGFPTAPPDQTRTAQAGPLWSQGVASPTSMLLTWGDGNETVCDVFDVAYDPENPDLEGQRPTCARYLYEVDSHDRPGEVYRASVTVTYDIWVTTSETPAPVLAATVAGPTLDLDFDVAQLQAVIR